MIDISFKETDKKDHFIYKLFGFGVILTGREKMNKVPIEIIVAWPNMWTYQTLCAAHAHRIDDVPLGDYY